MKKFLLLIFFIIFYSALQAQKDTLGYAGNPTKKGAPQSEADIEISIFPVPVRDNSFTIRTNQDVTFVRITNIIGQDIFRTQFNNPQQLTRITLDNPKRGMYLVTILFSDGKKVVKKIMIEEPR